MAVKWEGTSERPTAGVGELWSERKGEEEDKQWRQQRRPYLPTWLLRMSLRRCAGGLERHGAMLPQGRRGGAGPSRSPAPCLLGQGWLCRRRWCLCVVCVLDTQRGANNRLGRSRRKRKVNSF